MKRLNEEWTGKAAGESLEDVIEGHLNRLFHRRSGWSHPVSGSDSEVMEALLVSLIRPTETVLVPVYGPRGRGFAAICEACGADPMVLDREGEPVIDLKELEAELRRRRPSVLIVSHSEPPAQGSAFMEATGSICQELDVLLVADCAETFGDIPILSEGWHLDAVVGAPLPSLSLTVVAYNERALAKLHNRRDSELPFLRLRDQWRSGESSGNAGRQGLLELRKRLAEW
ncbi:hypothetical protein [Paenibacillus sp. PL2-23]|uniref:hypothetical protein n=1 Tax=Paenibacillus sp. PL2-23 TaxID=2100729 RepID=UPI0030F65E99